MSAIQEHTIPARTIHTPGPQFTARSTAVTALSRSRAMSTNARSAANTTAVRTEVRMDKMSERIHGPLWKRKQPRKMGSAVRRARPAAMG